MSPLEQGVLMLWCTVWLTSLWFIYRREGEDEL